MSDEEDGYTLREIRQMRMTTQGELARAMGVTDIYVQRLEARPLQKLTMASVTKYLRGLGMRPAVLGDRLSYYPLEVDDQVDMTG